MSFYAFRFEKFQVFHKRGIIDDQDLVTFTVLINQIDRGHGSVLFPVVPSNSVHSIDDIADTGAQAYAPGNTLNMTKDWTTGPFELAPDDEVVVIYTGTNTSDSSLSSLAHQEQDELELKILNAIAKKGVAVVLGAGLGEELGNAFSEAFKETVEDFIGYKRQGPCNGPVFSDAIRFSGNDLDNLNAQLLPYTRPDSAFYSGSGTYRNPGVRYTHHYTDEATHNSDICGHFADTDVTFSLFRLPYVSVKDLMSKRFPNYYPSLRKARPPGSAFSVKRVLGVWPKG